ncbi:MAG: hypothetical protein II886_13085 [Prevotella sp.]|nr:hypothetical protein [Prevotella sp.]
MILSEYQAKREALEKKMQEIGEREAAHKMELSIKHQAQLQKIASQIGNLKHQRAEVNKQYENDKAWFHRKYRDEKRQVTQQMHALRMEYLTVNGVQDVRPAKLTPPSTLEQHDDE